MVNNAPMRMVSIENRTVDGAVKDKPGAARHRIINAFARIVIRRSQVQLGYCAKSSANHFTNSAHQLNAHYERDTIEWYGSILGRFHQ